MAAKMTLYKLVVLGDGGVGKTALVIQMTLNHFVETYDPTIEDSYRKQVVIDGQSTMIEVLDTAGQEEYTALRDQWIRDSEAVALVYSITSRNTFTRIQMFYSQVLRVKESVQPQPNTASLGTDTMTTAGASAPAPPALIPIMLVANKADREIEREVSTAEGFSLARELGCMFVEASAKNCLNVEKIVFDLVRELRRQRSAAIQPCRTGVPVTPQVRYRPHKSSVSKFGTLSSLFRLFQVVKVDIREEYRHDIAHQLAVDKVLVQAARLNDVKALKKCLTNGANPNAQPGSEGSALQASAVLGHSRIVKILLESGAAPNAKGPREMTALQAASAEGHRDVVKILLKAGADVNTSSSLHGTALLAAASRGQVEVARILVKHGADVNAKGGQYGNALQAAAVVGKLEMARILLDAGASVHARGEGECTVLQAACNAGHASIARLLIERGADINAPGGKFGYALQAANSSSRFDVFDLLLSYRADMSILDPSKPIEQTSPRPVEEPTSQAPDMGNLEQDASPAVRLASPHASEGDLPLPEEKRDTRISHVAGQKIAVDSEYQRNNATTSTILDHRSQSPLSSHPTPLPVGINTHSAMHVRSLSSVEPLASPPDEDLEPLPNQTQELVPLRRNKVVADGHVRSRTFHLSHMYSVAIICPMAVELAPVEAMLDALHPSLPTGRMDHNVYTLGSLGEHNVVVAVMPGIGTNSAAVVATQLLNDFPSIRFTLLVGIGGGIPGEEDIRLGDVVVSRPTATFGGVVQYDMGKSHPNGVFRRTGALRKPPPILSATVEKLRARHWRDGSQISEHLVDMMARFPKLVDIYAKPGSEHDLLFQDAYTHQGGQTCSDCDPTQLASRDSRSNRDPKVHYGTIGSANALVRDSVTRSRLKQDSGIICVEMEAAGLMETFPCLVIRGICDYADSHKNDIWQPYAAATAAAYMKEVLLMIPPMEVARESRAIDVWL